MTQRSILAGPGQAVIVKAGASVVVKGHDGDRVVAHTKDPWGLKVEKRSAAEIGRARAAVGDRVLFDLHLKVPGLGGAAGEVIEVQLGGSGEVLVPFGSAIKVYAGLDLDVQEVRGRVDAYSGRALSLHDVERLGHAAAGGAMDLDCRSLLGDRVEFKAGRDLRFRVRELTSATIRVTDLGGYWEARIGGGERLISLKCGGDVTLVTEHKVEPLPPNFVLGNIERPVAD